MRHTNIEGLLESWIQHRFLTSINHHDTSILKAAVQKGLFVVQRRLIGGVQNETLLISGNEPSFDDLAFKVSDCVFR